MAVIPITKAKAARRRRSAIPPTAPETGHFTAPDGTDLYFEDSGGTDPVLFYVYGLGCSILHWKYPMGYFDAAAARAAGRAPHRQIWMDFRGHGRSARSKAGERLTMRTIVDDIRALCDYRGIEHATVLGQSMGGSIALELAHQAPELVSTLVLLTSPSRDPGGHLPLQPLSGILWRTLIELNQRMPHAVRLGSALMTPLQKLPFALYPLRELVRQLGFNPRLAQTDDIDEYVRKALNVDPNLFYEMAAALRSFDVATLQPPVACPALVIAGGRDQIVPAAESRRLAASLPRGELCLIPHGSHCPHFDDPALVNRRIELFLAAHGL